jgi:hypothetical protein
MGERGAARPFKRFFRKDADRPPKHTGETIRMLNSFPSLPTAAFLSAFFESFSNRGFDVAGEYPEAQRVIKARCSGRAPECCGREQTTSSIGHEPYFRSSNRDETP